MKNKKESKEEILQNMDLLGITEEYIDFIAGNGKRVHASISFCLYSITGMGFTIRMLTAIELLLGRRFYLWVNKKNDKNTVR